MGSVEVIQLEVGLLQNFNYLIADQESRECAYVDPAWEVDRLLKIADEKGYLIKKVLLTHCHHDHVNGVDEAVQKTGVEVYIHPDDEGPVQQMVDDISPVHDGTEIPLGKLTVTVLHTPGHTPGSVCYLASGPQDPIGHLFTGDTLFQGRCGRWDFPEGDARKMFESLQMLKTLDPLTKVYPGHDYGSKPVTTIEYERQYNPTMAVTSFEEFGQFRC